MNKVELIAQQLANSIKVRNIWGDIIINVKESPYNAIGDWNGTTGTDDTLSFQKAIDYAISIGKNDIWLPPGGYKYTTLTNTENITFYGDYVTLHGTTVLDVVSFHSLGVRIDNIVASAGDSNTEIVDARLPMVGAAYPTLKDRLDTENAVLEAQIEAHIEDPTSAHIATAIGFNPEDSGLSATNVDGAIKEQNTRIDNLVISGDSGPEAADARVSAPYGVTYPTLKDRVDHTDTVAIALKADVVTIGQKKIFARDYGVKLDGVTDDTAALNIFFSHFGEGELIVDNGVALVTGQLKVPGVWRPDTGNSSVKRLTFVRASIKYTGPANKAVMQFYNHFMSVIDGVAITRDSNPTYINFAGFWYSKFLNFESPKITFGYNNSDIVATLLSSANFTNVIEKGYLFGGGMEFYGTGVSGSSVMNSLRVNDVLFDGRSAAAYNMKFYGTGFQNFVFNGCDISYATTAAIYIDVTQPSCSLHLNNCYFDTGVPLLPNYDFKGSTITINQSEESGGNTNQFSFYKTENMMMGEKRANRGYEPNVLPKGIYNYMYNGDLAYNISSGSWLTILNAPTATWNTNPNTLAGNSLNIVFSANSQQLIFTGITVPQTGVYTCGLRIKKNSGNSIVQISYNGISYSFDLGKIPDGSEVILSSHANFKTISQGSLARFSIVTQTINAGANIDILEVFMIDGTYSAFNLPLHPKANIYKARTTAQRPNTPIVGDSVFDTTLNKPIWWNGASWVDKMSAFVSVPASATATGNIGDWSADATWLYICHATNTWKRVGIATW